MSEIPKFANEQEEAEFWAVHDATEYLANTEPVTVSYIDARPSKKLISLRMDVDTIHELKVIAARKGIGYQTLIRMWVKERLTQEVG